MNGPFVIGAGLNLQIYVYQLSMFPYLARAGVSCSVSQVCSLTLLSSIVPLPFMPIMVERFSLGDPFLMMSADSPGMMKSWTIETKMI